MRPWLFALGGLIIWGVHFAGVYAFASLAEIAPDEMRGWRGWALAFSGACLLAAGALLALALRGARATGAAADMLRLWAGGGAALALLAIGWQSLPLIFGP